MSRSSVVPANAASMSCSQLRMLDPRHAIDRLREVLPDRSLPLEHAAAARRQTVITAPPLTGLLHPAAFDHALRFEAIERRIERGDVKGDGAVGSLVDQLADFIAMTLALFEQRQDQQLGTTALQLPLQHRPTHIWAGTISCLRSHANA